MAKAAKAPERKQAQARDVAFLLKRALPDPTCELRHENAWQLLIATILSAQSTDRRVNEVTPVLFARYPTPEALGDAPQEEVEEVVRSTGFFRNKAKSIRGASGLIASRHGGEVPKSIEALCDLPGVARKTANVVLGTAYRIATGIVVDTHVTRVSGRLGLTTETDPTKIEAALTDLFPKRSWIDIGHRLLLHGRYVCLAKRPLCASCCLNEICPSVTAVPDGSVAERTRAEADKVGAALAESLAS